MNDEVNNSLDEQITSDNKEDINPVTNDATTEEPIALTPGPSEEEKNVISNDETNLEASVSTPDPLSNDGFSSGDVPAGVPPIPTPSNDQTAMGFEEKKDKAKGVKTPLIIVAALVIVGLLGYFVVFPFVKTKLMSSPKTVFENTIMSMKKAVNQTLKDSNFGTSINDVSISFETSSEELKEFENYTYGLRFGLDNKNKAIEGKLYMLDKSKKEYSALGYVKNDDILVKLSGDERLVKVGKTSDIDGFDEIFDTAENVNIDDYTYLVDKSVELLLSNFTDADFTKENSTIKVNDVEVKATKNTYVLDKEKIKAIYKSIAEGLYNDSRAMEIIKKMGISKEDYKKDMDSVTFDEIEDDYKLYINIYTNKKADVIGFDVVFKDQVPFYYYSNEGNFDLYIENDESEDKAYTAKGIKNGEITNVTIKEGSETYATLKVSKWTDNEIVFDYDIKMDENNSLTGSVDFRNSVSNSANNIALKLSAKSGSDSLKFNFNLKQELNVKIADVDVNKAVNLSDEEMNTWLSNFLTSVQDTPISYLFDTLGNTNEPTYYNGDYNYSYNAEDAYQGGENIEPNYQSEDSYSSTW